MDLADTDSSVGEVESVEDFEDTPESCHVEDDIFIDNIQSTRNQYLSELLKHQSVLVFVNNISILIIDLFYSAE